MAFSFSASEVARWLVSVAMRRACCDAWSNAAVGLGQRRLAGLHFDLERPRIDPVERIAGLDLAALVEQALDDDAGNPRAHVGDPGRRDPPRQFADDARAPGVSR